MKPLHRWISLLLTASIVLTSLPVNAFAKTTSSTVGLENAFLNLQVDRTADEIRADVAKKAREKSKSEQKSKDTVSLLSFTETVSGYCGGEGDGTNLIWSLTPDGVLTIVGSGAMADYIEESWAPWAEYSDSVHTLVLSEGITSIGVDAFYGMTSVIGELVLPESLIEIGQGAFYECSGLSGDLVIPDGVTEIRDYTFYGCAGLDGNLILGKNTESIGVSAFCNCASLTGTLNFPETISYIGEDAFYGMSSLTGELNLPEDLIEIGECAFYECTGLSGDLVFPDSVTEIKDYAFYGCTGLDGNLTLSKGMKSIGLAAFYGCSALKGTLSLPESITHIDDYAFYTCSGFTGAINLPDGLEAIAPYTFWGCSGFDSTLSIPASITSIGEWAFYGCSGLTGELVLPTDLEHLGRNSFYDCSGFTGELIIPADLSEIGISTFYNCSGFTGDLTIPDEVTSIGNAAFYNCTGFDGELILPDGITDICYFAFAFCSNLSGTLELPNSLQAIGEAAFAYCSGFNDDLYIPVNVTHIDDFAFYACDGIKNIYFYGDAPDITALTIENGTFDEDVQLYFDETKSGWKEAPDFDSVNNTWKGYCISTWLPSDEVFAELVFASDSQLRFDIENSVPATVIAAVYSNKGQMLSCNIQELKKAAGVTTFDMPSYDTNIASTVKLLFVKNRDTMLPLQQSISFDVKPFYGAPSVITVTEVCLNTSSLSLEVGNFASLIATVKPNNATNKTVNWTTTAPAVATVDSNGLVTATGVGTATITATADDGSGKCASCTVTVSLPVCNHADTNRVQLGDTSYNQISGDDEKHQVEKHYKVDCNLCHEMINYDLEELTIEDHTFDQSDKCTKCQYQLTLMCDHTDTSRVQVGSPVYKMIADDDENHLVTTYFAEKCDYCGATVTEGITETTSEAHTFNENGKCEPCGYEKCLHTDIIKEYVKTTYAQITDNAAQHQVTNYYKCICDNCAEVTDTSHTETLIAVHTFDDSNKCTLCNYIKLQETVEIVEPVLIHPALSTDEDILPAYTEDDMTLAWGAVEGAVKYTVRMDEYWDDEWDEEIKEEETTEESFTIPEIDLEGGGIYRVRITAYGADEESKSSDWHYFRIGAASYIWVKDELEVGYEADEYSISVCTSRNWQATVSDRSWITISATRGFASTSLDLEVTENTGDFPRTGTITFTNDAGGYALLTLIQEGNGSGNEGRVRIDYPEQGETVDYDRLDVEWTNFIWTATEYCKVELYDVTDGRTAYGPKTTTADYYNIPKSALSQGHIYRLTVTACSVQGTEVAKATVVFKVEGSASGGGSGTDSDDEVIETPEVPEGNTEILYSGIVNNSKIDMQDISVSWQEVIGSDYYAVALRDMTLYPDGTPDANVRKEINTTTQELEYTISSSKLVYGHTYRLWIAAHKNGVNTAINGKNIWFTVESAPLKWDADLDGDSKIVVNVLEGTPDANTPYLFIAEDSDGRHYPGNSTPNISAGATSATFRIKDLQMKRAKAYDLYVLPAGVSLTDDNRSQYFITDIVVPLWGGNMISAVRSGGTNVTYTKKLYLDEDIEIDWEGSYGVYNVEITARLNGQIVFTEHCTEPELIDQDTPVTTTISKSRFSTAEDGDELEITVTVTPTTTEEKALLEAADYKSSESSPWYGTCAIKAEVPNVDDMFAIDDIRFTVDMDLYEIYGEEYAKPDSLISICFIRDIELVSADNVFFRIGDSYTGKPKAITEYAGKIDMSFAAELPSLNTVTIYFPAYSLRDSSTGIMNVEIVSCSFVTGSDGALGNYRDLLSIQYGEQMNCFEGVFRRCFVAEYDSESSLFIVDTKSANVSSVSIYDPNGTVLSRSADSTVIAKTKFQGKETEKHLVFVWFENGNIGSFGFNTFVPYDEVSLNSGDAVEIYVSEELKSKWWYSDDFLQRNTWASQYTLATAKELFPTIYKKGHETYKYVYCDIAEWYELFTGYVAGSVAGVNTDVIFIESPEGAGPNTVIHTIAHETQHSLWSLNVCADGFFNEVMSQYIAANTIDLYNILSGTSYDRFSGNSLGIYDSYSTNQLYEKLTERTSGDYALYYYFGEFLNETIGIDGMRNILYRLSQQGEDSSAVDMENIIAKECGMNTFNGSSSSVMHSFSVWINTQ